MHTTDATGKTKCHKIHVGSQNLVCPELHVHNTSMKQVTEDTYLGDVIRSDGRNISSIKNRVSRGIGCISQIMTLLERVSFGKFFFQIALSLREAIFLNSVLTNTEVWYGLRKQEVDDLESLDRDLLCQILSLPQSTPSEALYLESGCLNIGTIVKMRRVNYLHYLLKFDNNSMLSKFFHAQYAFPVRGDWSEQVKEDLKDLDIQENFEWIKSKSKDSFCRLVKKKGREFALNQFNEKKISHTKLDNLCYPELKLQSYLERQDITVKQAKILLKFRTRMAKYSNNYGCTNDAKQCELCQTHSDRQEEIYMCEFNKKNIRLCGSYMDLFQSEVKVEVIKTLEEIYKKRENTLS